MATAQLNPIIGSLNGTVGRLVFYTRHGKTVMRIWIQPPNPRTQAQQSNRERFARAMASWQGLSPDEKASHNARARKLGMTGHNLFIRECMRARDRSAPDRVRERFGTAPLLGGEGNDIRSSGFQPDPGSRAPSGGQGLFTGFKKSAGGDEVLEFLKKVDRELSNSNNVFKGVAPDDKEEEVYPGIQGRSSKAALEQ